MAAGMAVNAAARVWTPFKDLQNVVESAIDKKQPHAIHELEVMLQKHKTNFTSLLKNQAKNPSQRELVKKSNTVGLPVHGEQHTQTFTESMIAEAIIISDLFDLNEIAALELLVAGEDNIPNFPGLTRGLVAVLLYYDGRRSIVTALRTLLYSLEGPTYTLDLPPDLVEMTRKYIEGLVNNDGLINQILGILKEMDVTKELEKLQNNRALGPPKYKKQVKDMYEEIQVACAECLFCLACQRPLSKNDTLQLISRLKEENSLQMDGTLHPVTLTLLLALLYCFDVTVFEREGAEDVRQDLPILTDPQYIADIHKELKDGSAWKIPGLRAVALFAWGVTLRQLSQYPFAAGAGEYYEEDESILDLAVQSDVFEFLHRSMLAMNKFHREEFYLRKIHRLVTDFIYQFPLKVKEIRNHGDETARIIIAHLQEGQEPPGNLRRDFEHMLHMIHELYIKDPLGLELSVEYWCPPETGNQYESFHRRPPQKQVALYKFVRMAGDLIPPSLYVPYINMLTALANNNPCAHHCYNLLKINGNTSSTVSLDHIFTSLHQYYSSLRRESPSMSDSSFIQRTHQRAITPQELDGLIAVLKLVKVICEQNEYCRFAVFENQQWSVSMTIFGLITCSIPPLMKSELLKLLAALCKTPDLAASIWLSLEASQILVTVPTTGEKQGGGIQVELDDIESRNEEYPITRGFLEFLDVLTDTPVPAALGAGTRAPGFDPYLQFIRDDVFLKCGSRAYKNPGERWEVTTLCLSILRKILHSYEVHGDHFMDPVLELQSGGTVLANKPAGFTLLVHMLRDSRLLQMTLTILDDAMKHFETYTQVHGQEYLEKSALLCLQMIEDAFVHEELFIDLVRETGSPLLLSPLNKLLLGINQRSGKADFMISIAKYLTFNIAMPEHALSAARILYLACKAGPVQSELVMLFTERKETKDSLLHGFVDCLDYDDMERPQEEGQEEITQTAIHNSTRQHILKLMIQGLEQPAPNLAHFLLGFEITKPVGKTNLQDQGILGSPKTCLHSILALLSRGLGTSSGPQCLQETPKLSELCFRLIYMLAANHDTSLPTLRYLRTSHDFLYRHVQHVPYDEKLYFEPVLNHQSWLLKTVAVELRVTSINRQRSHTQRLMKLILDDYDEDQTSVMQLLGQGPDESDLFPFSRYADLSSAQYGRNVRGRQYRRRIMSILDTINFHQDYPEQLNLKYFDTGLIQQVVVSVERRDQEGIVYYDVKRLHRILMNELNNLQGTTMAGQRHLIIEEIDLILKNMIKRNIVCQCLHSKQQGFDAWRQVIEIILTACPEDLLHGEVRQTVLFEILQDLLIKVADEDSLTELTSPVAGVVLTLLANLRLCFVTEDSENLEREKKEGRYISMLDKTPTTNTSVTWGQGSGSRTLFATSLQMVLKGLIEYIMRSSGGQQRVRAKLYGAFLYYLQIANKPKQSSAHLQEETSSTIENRLQAAADTEYDQLRKENISTILSYGDTFMDLVCRDACDGIDIGKMLALSVLDSILTMDKFHQWLTYISSKGYLQHMVDSLLVDGDKLQQLLQGNVEHMKILFLFESKMGFLTRVAETAEGATTLLRYRVMQQLAACLFFNLRPETDRSQLEPWHPESDSFILNPLSRYRHLLYATLKFCLAILTSLGTENSEAGKQVMQFVVAHGDVFNAILHDRQPLLNLHCLQELALTTAVISRANIQDNVQHEIGDGDTAAIEFKSHCTKLKHQMIALYPRYCLSEKLTKQLKNMEAQSGEESKDLHAELMQAYLDVSTNVTSYCRMVVSSGGSGSQLPWTIFRPGMEEAMARDLHGSGDFSSIGMSQGPSLGKCVYQLKQCTHHFMSAFENRKQYLCKLDGLTELSVDDLKQFSGVSTDEKMSSQLRQMKAKKRLSQLIQYNHRELQSYAYMIESNLFLLWRHLEFYLIHYVPADKMQSRYQGQTRKYSQMRRLQDVTGLFQSPSSRDSYDELGPSISSSLDVTQGYISQQDIDTLKQAIPSALSDSLFKKIQEINQIFCKNRSHYGFVEAVVRRLKRLLRLHTGN